MAKPVFYYANGTAYLINIVELGFNINNGGIISAFGGDLLLNKPSPSSRKLAVLESPDGRAVTWDGAPENDPFPLLLNKDLWRTEKIPYPAAAAGIGASIDIGIEETIKRIQDLAPGTPFALGGYSQGAAVMSGVYNQIKSSSGSLYSRRNDFLGGTMFGNPRRQNNYRGSIGGTWSGAWDVSGSTTGGHGSFPTTGTHARLTGCESSKWIEFTAPNDIFSSSGDSSVGSLWTQANQFFLGQAPPDIAGKLILSGLASLLGLTTSMWSAVTQALGRGGGRNFFIDATNSPFTITGSGHTTYPFWPPPNSNGSFSTTRQTFDGVNYYKPNGQTCYQLAVNFLDGLAKAKDTASLAVPDSAPGWSTTLTPPAS